MTKLGKIAFMFPGQGSFDSGMGREIAEAEPAAMAVFDEGSKASGLDLRMLCFSGTHEELMETEVQQPALVTTSLAINAALRARGIVPDFVVGHSVGEFSALGAAGSLGVAEAIALVRERGLAMAAAAKERDERLVSGALGAGGVEEFLQVEVDWGTGGHGRGL